MYKHSTIIIITIVIGMHYLQLEFMYWVNESSYVPETCWSKYSLTWSWSVLL